MNALKSEQILYIKPQQSTLVAGELKGAFEYDGGHGSATFFVSVAFAPQLFDQPEFQEIGAVETVKFLRQKQDWNVIFSDESMSQSCVFSMLDSDMQELCEKNHIALVHV